MVRQALSSGHPWLRGITFERLWEEGWARLATPPDFRPFAEGGFPTPSGKAELLADPAHLVLEELTQRLIEQVRAEVEGPGSGLEAMLIDEPRAQPRTEPWVWMGAGVGIGLAVVLGGAIGAPLRFLVDGAQGTSPISGEVAWTPVTVSIPAGTHFLQWTYAKDANTIGGSDAAWVDKVLWTGGVPAIVSLDVNGDGVVDLRDLLALAARYGTAHAAADLNADGVVNDLDIAVLLAGLTALEERDLAGTLIEAVARATKRSKELGKS